MFNQRVLFFDSGMGGLTILHQVKLLCPSLECCYLFDNACFPYGSKSEGFLVERVDQLLKAGSRALQPDLIVVACNTASTIALPVLRHDLTIPIVGVVPAIKPAAKLTKKGVIGLLATPGTVKRHYTEELIEKYAHDCTVLRLGTTALVEIAERKLQGIAPRPDEVVGVLAPWLSLPQAAQPDVIVLGCTHYPLLHAEIAAAMGPQTALIDSGAAVARRVSNLLFGADEPPAAALLAPRPRRCRAFCTALDGSIAARSRELSMFGFRDIELLPGMAGAPPQSEPSADLCTGC